MTARRVPIFLSLLAILALSCSSPPDDRPGVPADRDTPRSGGFAVIGSISDVDAWNEYLARSAFTTGVLSRIYERLARPAGPGDDGLPTYEPRLAESWTFSDDGRTLSFALRDAVWSDGSPVTAGDVRFTWQAQTSGEVAWAGAGAKAAIESVDVVDDRTVVFRFSRVYPDQLADAIDGGILPRHVFGEVPFADWRTFDWSESRTGSGPFLLEHHAPGHEIRLVRNERFFGTGGPHLDGVTIRIVPDASNLGTQVLAGGVDYMEGAAPRDAERLAAAPGVRVMPIDRPNYTYVGWNGDRAPLGDPEIRRALGLAIDRVAIVEELLYGFGVVSAGPVPSAYWAADPDSAPLPYDPDRAHAILAERGFGPDGAPLAIEIATNAGNELRAATLVKMQEYLGRVGVELRILPAMQMGAFVERNMAGEFEAYVASWTFTGKVELHALFGSGAIPPAGYNVVRYRSAATDARLESLDAAATPDEARAAIRSVAEQVRADQPYTFLFELRRLAVTGPALRGVTFDVPNDSLAFLEHAWLER